MERDLFKKEFPTVSETARAVLINEFVREHGKLRDYHFAYNVIRDVPFDNYGSVAVLNSFTVNQIKEPLSVELAARGLNFNIDMGGYNQFRTEILDGESFLYKQTYDLILLVIRSEELFPALVKDFLSLSAEEVDNTIISLADEILTLLQTLRRNSSAKIVINNFIYPRYPAQSIYDYQNPRGQIAYTDKFNALLREKVSEVSDAYIFDMNYEAGKFGYNAIADDRMEFISKNPFSSEFLIYLARQYARFIASMLQIRKKCLVLDLDNTLWGGVIGEEGLEGIALGEVWPGNVYKEIQRTVKALYRSGVILALNSKNNIEDVREVFEKHPDMILQWDDFAVKKINWNNKAQNMKEIAEDLNIGLDSLVFVDDNPAEIELINRYLPQVTTISFSSDPLTNLRTLREITCFDNLQFTPEDFRKGEQYKTQAARASLKRTASNIEEYYYDLQMKLTIKECDKFALKRVAQLTRKTNQFNLTTRRYSESDIEKFMLSREHLIYYVRLEDRFGDNGITGVAIIEKKNKVWHIDSFLMSCRIIGRTVETALLSYILEQAAREDVSKITGEFIPTAKNKPVKDFYAKHGFEKKGDLWELKLPGNIKWPEWIEKNV